MSGLVYNLEYKHNSKKFRLSVELAEDGNIDSTTLTGPFLHRKTASLLEKVKLWVNAEMQLPRIRVFLQRETLFPHTEVDFLMRLATDLERLRSGAVAKANS